jgi:hypothetical protein
VDGEVVATIGVGRRLHEGRLSYLALRSNGRTPLCVRSIESKNAEDA